MSKALADQPVHNYDCSKLKRCPFCGSSPKATVSRIRTEKRYTVYISCHDYSTPQRHYCSVYGRATTQEEALKIAVSLWEERRGL
jgi:formate dehydrogenase maturation protein FdhE